MNKIRSIFKETVEEMRYKVSWLKYSELQSSTTLVIVGTLVFALVIWVIDSVFENGITVLYEMF
ncbi:MAG: preprotein translocase subunit SecE [Bacteroidetes bacterium]|nr:preprotein translocase subunit SecE [Bacteroidota bacterium]